MQSELKKYNGFQESILQDVVWKQWGYNIELHLNYIHTEDNTSKENQDENTIMIVEFLGVQEFTAKNCWNKAVEENPEKLNWGAGEISIIRIEDSETLLQPYQQKVNTYRHAAILWESDRRIDIVFSKLKIYQKLHSVS